MRHALTCLLALNVIIGMAFDKNDYLSFLPGSVQGWKPANSGIIYDANTLYDYIDGGAELYISYGFENVISREYNKPDEANIHVEIFDMVSSYNAYGVFSNTAESANIDIGQGAQYIEGSLLFWKDKFFVSVFADDENEEVKKAILEIAHYIDSAIATEGKKPEIIRYLDVDGVKPESIVYFIHPAWQNYYHYICNENIFNISAVNDAATALYDKGDSHGFIVIVHYENDEKAAEQLELLKEYFREQTDETSGHIDLGDDMVGRLYTRADNILLAAGIQNSSVHSTSE